MAPLGPAPTPAAPAARAPHGSTQRAAHPASPAAHAEASRHSVLAGGCIRTCRPAQAWSGQQHSERCLGSPETAQCHGPAGRRSTPCTLACRALEPAEAALQQLRRGARACRALAAASCTSGEESADSLPSALRVALSSLATPWLAARQTTGNAAAPAALVAGSWSARHSLRGVPVASGLAELCSSQLCVSRVQAGAAWWPPVKEGALTAGCSSHPFTAHWLCLQAPLCCHLASALPGAGHSCRAGSAEAS